jgi:hypothetical protein
MNTENCGNACAQSETVTAPNLPGLIVTRVDSAAPPPRRKRRRASSLLASAECSGGGAQASPCLPRTSSCACLSAIPPLLRLGRDFTGYRMKEVEATEDERASVRRPDTRGEHSCSKSPTRLLRFDPKPLTSSATDHERSGLMARRPSRPIVGFASGIFRLGQVLGQRTKRPSGNRVAAAAAGRHPARVA